MAATKDPVVLWKDGEPITTELIDKILRENQQLIAACHDRYSSQSGGVDIMRFGEKLQNNLLFLSTICDELDRAEKLVTELPEPKNEVGAASESQMMVTEPSAPAAAPSAPPASAEWTPAEVQILVQYIRRCQKEGSKLSKSP
mmetsp:Transcript_19671/g.50374  ORF Transcript_19671/g.50374 Transcript_19671/m.50374 type:complete len:143 (-) Transcript_19671:94-522(-)